MSKINVLRDMVFEHAKQVLERKLRDKLASNLNEMVEEAVKDAMANMEISLDGETLEIKVKRK